MPVMRVRTLAVLLTAVLVLLLPPGRAAAQGFSVSPIQVVADVPAGQSVSIPIALGNSTETRLLEISIRQVELLQMTDGTWRVADPATVELPEGHKSNRDWFEPSDEVLSIGPGQQTVVELTGSIPRGFRGTTVSALVITSNEQSPSGDAVRLRFQFLVPIILTASGRPSRQVISVDTLGLELRRPDAAIAPNARGRAIALAALSNTGETYSRMTGSIRVERQTGDGWRFVTNAEVSPRGIIPGAVLALMHDVTATIGFFAVTQLEFNLSTIAAILTIVGYSMNDTVVVYDRIREKFRKFKKAATNEVLDMAINKTLSRTILTSGTTLVALVALALIGGAELQGFALALIFGVVIGTYSSVFVAAPLLTLTGVKRDSGEETDAPAP